MDAEQRIRGALIEAGWTILPPAKYASDLRLVLRSEIGAVGWTHEDAYMALQPDRDSLGYPLRLWWSGNGAELAGVLERKGYRLWWAGVPGAPLYVGEPGHTLTHVERWHAADTTPEAWATYHQRLGLLTRLKGTNWESLSTAVLEQVLAVMHAT